MPTQPVLVAVFVSRLNEGTLTGVEDAVGRSRKLGLTVTSILSFAPRRSAARRFLNANFLYAIFDLDFFCVCDWRYHHQMIAWNQRCCLSGVLCWWVTWMSMVMARWVDGWMQYEAGL